MSKEVVQNNAVTLCGNAWDASVTPAKPKTSGTIYALIRLDKPGDADDGKYWDTNAGGSWQASPTTWPTATYKKGSVWTYSVPAGATNAKAGGRAVLDDLTDNVATPASSTVMAGGFESADIVSALHAQTDSTIAAVTAVDHVTGAVGSVTGNVGGNVAGSVGNVTGAVGSVTGLTPGNLDVAVSTRLAAAGYTAPDNAAITAIKAKTDNLPAIPASQGDVAGAAGAVLTVLGTPAGASVSADIAAIVPPTGSRQITVRVATAGGTRVPNVEVSVFDATNTAFVTGGTTNASGELVVALNDGTYSLRCSCPGYSFTVPETVVVTATAVAPIVATAWVAPTPADPGDCVIWDKLIGAGGAVVGATVRIRYVTPGSAGGYAAASPWKEAVTGSDGSFAIPVKRLAQVEVEAPAGGYGPPTKTIKTVPNAANQQLTGWV